LLITSNDRIKVTDFGFARITGRNEEEMKRMTYCGTDVSDSHPAVVDRQL
jgi:LIM domain kinase 1